MNNEKTTEALNFLQEECGELIVIASKVKRFGEHSENPEQPGSTAGERLIQEMGDVTCLMNIIQHQLGISDLALMQAVQLKQEKLNKYSKHLGEPHAIQNNSGG